MCKMMEDMRKEAAEEAAEETKLEIAFKLHDESGFSLEKIALIVSESLTTVQRWFAERPSAAK